MQQFGGMEADGDGDDIRQIMKAEVVEDEQTKRLFGIMLSLF